MKKFLIIMLSLISLVCLFVGCKGNQESSGNPSEWQSYFQESYETKYGETYYFDKTVLDGKPLEYKVAFNGQAISTNNYSFVATNQGEYKVEVFHRGETTLLAKFTVISIDNTMPNIALSYYQKFVGINETVNLPEVTVSDNFDKELNVVKTLKKDGQEVAITGESFTAESGKYVYTVSVTDTAGNATERECLIVANDGLSKNIALNWSNANSPLDFYVDVNEGEETVSKERVYAGFDASFELTITNPKDTTCIIFKNSLIEDISEYDYLCCYVYNDMTSIRSLSYNWSGNSDYGAVLNIGVWTPVVFKIDETMVSSSNNEYLRNNQDWTSLNGQRFYIQHWPETATGSLYFSDIYLLNEIDVQEFVAKAEEYSSNPLSEQYAIEYTELDLQYQTIKNNEEASTAYYCVLEKYCKEICGDQYPENTIAYADDRINVTQITSGAWDNWSIPHSIVKTTKEKYGDERASIEVTWKKGLVVCPIKIQNPTVTQNIKSGEIVFYVKNATQSEVEFYTDGGPIKTAEISDEWQKIVLGCPTDRLLADLTIYIRGKNDQITPNDGTAKVYISSIYCESLEAKEYPEQGTLFAFSEGLDGVSGWIGSYEKTSERQYNGKDTLKIEDRSNNMMGFGLFLSGSMFNALLEQSNGLGVRITFNYYLTDYEWMCNYIYFGGRILPQRGKDSWQTYSAVITEKPENFMLSVLAKEDGSYGSSAKGCIYVSDITYEIVKPLENSGIMFDFSENTNAVTSGWVGAYSCSNEQQFEGKNTLKLSDNTDNMQGFGVFLDNTMLKALFEVDGCVGVKLTFNYYVHDYEWYCSYISIGNVRTAVTAKDCWQTGTITLTGMPENFIIAIISSATGEWGISSKGYVYFSNISYEIITE